MSGPTAPEAGFASPDLRIVSTDSLIPHEHHDGQRLEPLIKAIEADGKLRNPPLVAELGDGRYVVLDGANRVTALSQMGVPCCLVQVVPYKRPFVELNTWHHAITDVDISELDRRIAATEGLVVGESDLIRAQAALARRVLLSYYIRADGTVVTVECDTNDLHHRTELLNHIVSIYLTNGRLHRTNAEHLEELARIFPTLCALMVFPSFTPAEVSVLAGDGAKLPPGLTRHVIQGRALRVNYPLDALRTSASLDEQNGALLDWMQARLDGKRVRYYAESTFLFDE